MSRKPYLDVAKKVLNERYPDAAFGIVSGSIVRGDATAHSDIDLVVIFEKLPNAYRESFIAEDWPIEAFVHDPETLPYFYEDFDRKTAKPALCRMVAEGIIIPAPGDKAKNIQEQAREFLARGPSPLSQKEIDARRYAITDIVDDLRSPRTPEECMASVIRLYEPLAEFYLRTRNQWMGIGKHIPRALGAHAPEFARAFTEAFTQSFKSGDPTSVIVLSEKVLAPHGGFFFAGDRRDAPAEFRYRTAKKQYRIYYEDPIAVKTGERVAWIPKDSEWAGWRWCVHPTTKKEGWVPERILRIEGDTALVIQDYSATELGAEPGQRFHLMREEAGWHWCKNEQGKEGWIPSEVFTSEV